MVRQMDLIPAIPLLVLPMAAGAQDARVGAVIPPAATLELIADVGIRTEGPAFAPDGRLYFVDLDIPNGGRIWRWDPNTNQTSVLVAPSGVAAGLAIGPDGNLYTAEVASGGGRRIGRIELGSGSSSTIADSYQGRPIHGANDLVFDHAGRLYFTEYVLLGREDVLHREGSGVYRVEPDGTVSRLVADAGKPNGIAISPDQRTLYVGSNRFDVLNARAILAYDLGADGRVQFRKVLVRYPPEQLPDGMAVDSDGNLYVAIFSGRPGVAVYDSTGVEIGFAPTPGPATNVTFGRGDESNALYITAATGVYRLTVNRRGHHPPWQR
jgi:gluconolactonase